jgi:hypothetical protein
MPYENSVFLTELIIRFRSGAQNLQYLFVFDVIVVENRAWVLPIWVLKHLSLVMLLLDEDVIVVIHLNHSCLSLVVRLCELKLIKHKNQ